MSLNVSIIHLVGGGGHIFMYKKGFGSLYIFYLKQTKKLLFLTAQNIVGVE